MKVLYISSRLNVADGSSVHGRAFAASVEKLGHDIMTYPEIKPLSVGSQLGKPVEKDIFYYIKRLRFRSIVWHLKQIHYSISDIIDFTKGLITSLKDFLKLRSIIKDFHPDVIVYRKYLFNYAAVWASSVYNIPCIAEVNSLNIAESQLQEDNKRLKALIHWAEKYPLIRTNHVFCVSDAIKQSLYSFLDPDNVSVVPNGVDAEVFDRSRFDTENVKQDLGLAGKTILGYAGSYQSWHDVQKAVDVLVKLNEIEPGFHLLLIGNGQHFAAIKQRVEDQDLESSVTQIDHVPHAEMPKHLAVFDIAVMTYPIFEGFYFSPLKMYEYMAMGIPVVSTDIGQIRDALEDGETGKLVQNPTVDEFVKAILDITSDKDLFAKMCENARHAAIEKHSWLTNASKIMDLCSAELNENARVGIN